MRKIKMCKKVSTQLLTLLTSSTIMYLALGYESANWRKYVRNKTKRTYESYC